MAEKVTIDLSDLREGLGTTIAELKQAHKELGGIAKELIKSSKELGDTQTAKNLSFAVDELKGLKTSIQSELTKLASKVQKGEDAAQLEGIIDNVNKGITKYLQGFNAILTKAGISAISSTDVFSQFGDIRRLVVNEMSKADTKAKQSISTELREITKSVSNVKLGSEKDTEFKELVAKNNDAIKNAFGRVKHLLVNVNDYIEGLAPGENATQEERKAWSRAKGKIRPIAKQMGEMFGLLETKMGQESWFSMSDIQETVTGLRTLQSKLTKSPALRVVTDKILGLGREIDNFQSFLTPTDTQTMFMKYQYGKTGEPSYKSINAISRYGELWSSILDEEKGFAARVSSMLQAHPTLAKNPVVEELIGKGKAIAETHSGVREDLGKQLELEYNGLDNNLEKLYASFTKDAKTLNAINKAVSRIARNKYVGGDLLDQILIKLESDLATPTERYNVSGDTQLVQAMRERTNFYQKKGIDKKIATQDIKEPYIDPNSIYKLTELMDTKDSIMRSLGKVGEYIVSNSGKSANILSKYANELRNEPEAFKYNIQTYSTENPVSELHNLTARLQELRERFKMFGSNISGVRTQAVESITQLLTDLNKGAEELKKAELYLEAKRKATPSGKGGMAQAAIEASNRLAGTPVGQQYIPAEGLVTPLNAANLFGTSGGGSGGGGRVGDIPIRDFVQNIVNTVKQARESLEALSTSSVGLRRDRIQVSKDQGISPEDVDVVAAKVEKEASARASILNQVKSERAFLDDIDRISTSIANKTLQRSVYEREIASLENKIKIAPWKSDEVNPVLTALRKEVTSLAKQGIGKSIGGAVESPIDDVIRGVDKALNKYNAFKTAISGGRLSPEVERVATSQMAGLEKTLGVEKSDKVIKAEIAQAQLDIVNKVKEQAEWQRIVNEYQKKELEGKLNDEAEKAKYTQAVKNLATSSKATGIVTPISIEDQTRQKAQERLESIKNARQEFQVLTSLRGEYKALAAAGQLEPQIFKSLDRSLKSMQESARAVGDGFDKVNNPIKRLAAGIGGIAIQMQQLAEWQMIWYSSKFFVQGIPALISGGVQYATMIDTWNAKMLRWGATSGQVSEDMKRDTQDIVKSIRKDLLEVPATFERTAETVQGVLAAGLDAKTVKGLTRDLAILGSSFPEIQMESFTTAMVGTFNVFKDKITEAQTDAGKFRVIIEQLLKAQAESVVRPEQFTKVLQYMSEVGKMAGYTTAQIFSMSTVLADTGIAASNAARLLSGFITQLGRPIVATQLHRIGIDLNEGATAAENLDTVMTALRSKIDATGSLPMKYMSFFTSMMPKEELKIFYTMLEKWDDVKKREQSIKGSKGSLETLLENQKGTIEGQKLLLQNTLREIGEGGGATKDIYGGMIKSSLDAARGALLVINPELAKGKFGFESLGQAGRLAYASMESFKSVVMSVLNPIVAVVGPLLKVMDILTKFPPTLWAIEAAITAIAVKNIASKIAIPMYEAMALRAGTTGKSASMLGFLGLSRAAMPTIEEQLVTNNISSAAKSTTGLAFNTQTLRMAETAAATSSLAFSTQTLKGAWGALLSPMGLVISGLTIGITAWEKIDSLQRENRSTIDNLVSGFRNLGSAIGELTDKQLDDYLKKLREAAEESRKTNLWRSFKESFIPARERNIDRAKVVEELQSSYQKTIEREKENISKVITGRPGAEEAIAKSRAIIAAAEARKKEIEGFVPKGEMGILSQDKDTLGNYLAGPATTKGLKISIAEANLARALAEGGKANFDKDIKDINAKVENKLQIPEVPINEYGKKRANLQRELIDMELRTEKDKFASLMKIEETAYEMMLHGDKAHYDKSVELIEKTTKAEINAETKGFEELMRLRAIERRDALNAPNRKAIAQGIRSSSQTMGANPPETIARGAPSIEEASNKEIERDLKQHVEKLGAIVRSYLNSAMGAWSKYYKSLRELEELENKMQAARTQTQVDILSRQFQGAMNRRDTITKSMYDRGIISDTEYFSLQLDNAKKTYEQQVLLANQTLAKWDKENEVRRNETEGKFTILEKLTEEAKQKSGDTGEIDLLKLPADLQDQLKQSAVNALKAVEKEFASANIEIPLELKKASAGELDTLSSIKMAFKTIDNPEYRQKFLASREEQTLEHKKKLEDSLETLKETATKIHTEIENNIEMIYKKAGASGVIGRTFEELESKYKKTGQSIAEATKQVASDIESMLTKAFSPSSSTFGRFDLKSLLNAVSDQIAKITLVNPLMKALSGFGKGLFGGTEAKEGVDSIEKLSVELEDLIVAIRSLTDALNGKEGINSNNIPEGEFGELGATTAERNAQIRWAAGTTSTEYVPEGEFGEAEGYNFGDQTGAGFIDKISPQFVKFGTDVANVFTGGAARQWLNLLISGFSALMGGGSRSSGGLFGSLDGFISSIFGGGSAGVNDMTAGIAGFAGSEADLLTSFHRGGEVESYHSGGIKLSKNEVLAKLLKKEYVLRPQAVAKYGKRFLDSLNEGTYNGGVIGWEGDDNIVPISSAKSYHSGGAVEGYSTSSKSSVPNFQVIINNNHSAAKVTADQPQFDSDFKKMVQHIMVEDLHTEGPYTRARKRITGGR